MTLYIDKYRHTRLYSHINRDIYNSPTVEKAELADELHQHRNKKETGKFNSFNPFLTNDALHLMLLYYTVLFCLFLPIKSVEQSQIWFIGNRRGE